MEEDGNDEFIVFENRYGLELLKQALDFCGRLAISEGAAARCNSVEMTFDARLDDLKVVPAIVLG